MEIGSWFTTKSDSYWRHHLENTSDYVIEQTGLTREKLTKILEYLDEKGIVK